MVNLDTLNNTISTLEKKATDIDSIIKKQQELHMLVTDINKLKKQIDKDSNIIDNITITVDKLINESIKGLIDIELNINDKFSEIQTVLIENKLNIKDSIIELNYNIEEELNKYMLLVKESTKEIEDVIGKVEVIDSNLLKKLNEIINENNKSINTINSAIETKIDILKSDINLELRSVEERLCNKSKFEITGISSLLKDLEKNTVNKLDIIRKEKVESDNSVILKLKDNNNMTMELQTILIQKIQALSEQITITEKNITEEHNYIKKQLVDMDNKVFSKFNEINEFENRLLEKIDDEKINVKQLNKKYFIVLIVLLIVSIISNFIT